MKSYSLLIKPIPYPDETPGSLLIRAAEANGSSSVFVLCQVQATSDSKALDSTVTHPEKFSRLLRRINLSADYISLGFQLQGSTITSKRAYGKTYIAYYLFRKDCRAFCPMCLTEKLYWRRDWLLRPYTVCIKHHILLYDHCPNCQNELSIGRNKIHICNHCGNDLRLVTCQQADANEIEWFMSLISNNCQKIFNDFSDYWIALEKLDRRLNNIITDHNRLKIVYEYFINPKQSKITLSNIINANTPYVHPEIQVVNFRRRNIKLNEYINSALKLCHEVNTPAPKHNQQYFNFSDTCAILKISQSRLSNLIDKGIIPIDPLKLKLISSKDVEQVLLSGIHKKKLEGLRGISIQEEHLLDTAAIAALLNVHPEIVRYLGLNGWLKMEKKKINGFIKNVTTVSDFEVFNNSYILVGTLAHKFGVNSTNLAEKLKHYSIHPIAGPHIDGLKTTLFYKKDIERITRAMITRLEHYHTNTGRLSHSRTKQVYYESDSELYISLKEAAQELHISAAKVAVLIQNKILKKDEHNHKVIMVEHASIYALTKALQRTDFISLPEAAKQLNCAINWLHINWIRTGCMKCYDYIYWKFVSTDDINKVKMIQKEYMTAIDASKLLGMHRTHIINLKAQGKINSVSFGESNPINLYRREDVLMLLKQQNDDNN